MTQSTKQDNMQFEIIGNRPHLRLDEEIAMIDKKAADEAFRKNKKEIIDHC